MRRLILAVAVAVAVAAVSATPSPAHGATTRFQRFTGFQDVPVVDSPLRYRLRLSYLVPGAWRRRAGATALSRTFGAVGGCRYTIRVRARAILEPAESVVDRVARLVPATGPLLLDSGTRRDAAWRVARTSGTSAITGLLVRPAPSLRTPPTGGGRVFLELRVTATPDPARECHIGVPRIVGAETGDTLATAQIGGFQL